MFSTQVRLRIETTQWQSVGRLGQPKVDGGGGRAKATTLGGYEHRDEGRTSSSSDGGDAGDVEAQRGGDGDEPKLGKIETAMAEKNAVDSGNDDTNYGEGQEDSNTRSDDASNSVVALWKLAEPVCFSLGESVHHRSMHVGYFGVFHVFGSKPDWLVEGVNGADGLGFSSTVLPSVCVFFSWRGSCTSNCFSGSTRIPGLCFICENSGPKETRLW